MSAQLLQVSDATTLPYTPQNLISNVFLGSGVQVSSINFAGKSESVGYFSGGTQAIGIDRGIILTTGVVESDVPGAVYGADQVGFRFADNVNGSGATDANLAAQTTGPLYDVAVYTITFVPTSDTLRFKYCFASEEYPEFACSAFNDVFGFFIQGPGYPTPTNIAIIPGTNLPVTINNLHPENGCAPLNDQFYHDNDGVNLQPTYDGFTDVFVAEAIVTPCQQYTIKLAIADVSDGRYDSGVFLEAKSFGTGSLRVSLETVSADGAIVEGCANASLRFKLPTVQAADYPIDYNVWGTATNGVDYQTIPTGLVIPAGQTELVVPVIGMEDHLAESPEYVAVDVQRDPCNRDTIYVYIKDNQLVAPTLRPDTTVCVGAPALNLDGTAPVTLPPPPTFSNTQDYNIPLYSPPLLTNQLLSPINVFGVQPTILGAGVIRSVCVNIDHTWVDDVDMFLKSPGGQFIELSTDNGGAGDNYTNTCFTPTATKKINFPGPFAPASATPFTGDWLPEGVWSDLWDGSYPTNGTWNLQLRDDKPGNSGTLRDWTITFEPSYKIDYNWTPAAGLSCPTCAVTNAQPQQNTVYTVVVTDSYGCSVSDSIALEVLPEIQAPGVICAGAANGSVSFSWTDIPTAVSYEVNVDGTGWVPANGQLLHNVTGLASNAPVELQVRAVNPGYACQAAIGTAVCCQLPDATATVQGVSCPGASNGSITVTPDGANPPYTFTAASQTNATGVFQNLAAGNISVTITDVSGCSTTQSYTVPSPAAVSGAVSAQPVLCFGGDDGSLSVVAGGGTPGTNGYTYKWSDPATQTTATASNLSIGNYTVTITDGNGCSTTATGSISQPADLVLTATSSLAKCFGTPSGSATASGAGGVPPYQFSWNNGINTALNPNIAAGSYIVTITDANGCAETGFVTVGQPTVLASTVSGLPVSCFNGNDGSGTAAPSGGTPPYSYHWGTTPVQNTQTATGLTANNYVVTVSDANNCMVVQGVTIGSPTALTASTSHVNTGCNGGGDGSATVTPGGGTGPYTFLWSDPASQSAATAANLQAGTYTVTVTDAHLCTMTQTATVSEPSALQLAATAQDALCNGASSGKITLTSGGGTTPYTYKWSSGETSMNLGNKPKGTYTVTLTDAKSCTTTASATIGEPAGMSLNAQTQAVRCYGEATGSINLNASGGTPGYQYKWEGPGGFAATGLLIDGLFAGTYTATVTDAKGCTSTLTEQIGQPALPLVIDLPDFADTICFGASNGVVNVTAIGGTLPYSFEWTGNGISQNTQSVNGLSPAKYYVSVTDANGCGQSGQTIVKQLDQLFAVGEFSNPRCHDGADGTARLGSVFYGAVPANAASFNYEWSTNPPQFTPIASNLKALETYSVTITDAQGCSASSSVTLGNEPAVQAAVTDSSNVLCNGEATGWARAAGSGGTGPYTYFWSPGAAVQTDSLAQGLKAGKYEVTVMDSKGCPDVAAVNIKQPPVLRADILPVPVKCKGGSDGALQAGPLGGSSPYQFEWSNGVKQPGISALSAGPYSLTLTDVNGCTYQTTAIVPEPLDSLSGTTNHENPLCFGARDGKIGVTGSGGTPPYRYALNNQSWTGAAVQIALGAGVYVPHVIDQNGCTAILDTVFIEQPDQVVVDLGPNITIELGRDTQLIAVVENGIEPLSYLWTLADSSWLSCLTCPDPVVRQLFNAHWFEVKVVDAQGCEASDRVQILLERPRRIFVPTGFSPNGDGENDRLLVHGQKNAKVLTFRVFDRWGELVYEAGDFVPNDYEKGWDGRFRGKDMDPGVFVWVLEVEYMDKSTEILKGETTLIR